MISKNCIKHINSLQRKKYRLQTGTFLVEGEKIVSEILRSDIKVKTIFALKSWILNNSNKFHGVEILEADQEDLKKMSVMQTPPPVMAECFSQKESQLDLKQGKLFLALDSVRDPGNFGTIIRIADWFGFDGILASEDCVEKYNSKVVQASMGSVFRLKIFYRNLTTLFQEALEKNIPIYGTFLEGENIYKDNFKAEGIIVLGNEGHGILPDTAKLITKKLFIPFDQKQKFPPESLNVSSAASVVCIEFFRRRNVNN